MSTFNIMYIPYVRCDFWPLLDYFSSYLTTAVGIWQTITNMFILAFLLDSEMFFNFEEVKVIVTL